MRRPVAVSIAALCALPLGCKERAPALDLTGVDRSDGAIPELEVPWSSEPATIDGVLDDAIWKSAPSTGPFVHPADGKSRPRSRVNAEARLAWDADNVFVAVRVFDNDPTTPFSKTDTDPHIWSKASGIEVMVQPGDRRDNRDYCEIQVDVGGAVWDTRFDDYNRPITGPRDARRFGHQDWSAKLRRAVGRFDGGYVVEMAVPFAALAEVSKASPPSPGDHWRVNVYSFRDGQRDSLAWSPILGKGNFHRAPRWGRVKFVRSVP